MYVGHLFRSRIRLPAIDAADSLRQRFEVVTVHRRRAFTPTSNYRMAEMVCWSPLIVIDVVSAQSQSKPTPFLSICDFRIGEEDTMDHLDVGDKELLVATLAQSKVADVSIDRSGRKYQGTIEAKRKEDSNRA